MKCPFWEHLIGAEANSQFIGPLFANLNRPARKAARQPTRGPKHYLLDAIHYRLSNLCLPRRFSRANPRLQRASAQSVMTHRFQDFKYFPEDPVAADARLAQE
jgi:hypothetical protein